MLTQLLNYTFIADKLMIDVFNQSGFAMPQAEYLFSHVLNAQHIWISRIRQVPARYERFQVQPVAQFAILQYDNEQWLKELIEGDISVEVPYRQSTGDEYTNNIGDILFQVVNHSTYHRAQVATQFRLNNIQPPATDYILLKREGFL